MICAAGAYLLTYEDLDISRVVAKAETLGLRAGGTSVSGQSDDLLDTTDMDAEWGGMVRQTIRLRPVVAECGARDRQDGCL